MPSRDVITPPIRPEFEREPHKKTELIGNVAQPLSLWVRLGNITILRRLFILVALALIWQIYSVTLKNPLMFPTFSATATAWVIVDRHYPAVST